MRTQKSFLWVSVWALLPLTSIRSTLLLRRKFLTNVVRPAALIGKNLSTEDSTVFFKNAPNKAVEGVWRLKHAIYTGIKYQYLPEYHFFTAVATNYRFNNIHQMVNTEEVDENLRKAYLMAFNYGPTKLHSAYLGGSLYKYVLEVCAFGGLPLLPETKLVLELTDNVNRIVLENSKIPTQN